MPLSSSRYSSLRRNAAYAILATTVGLALALLLGGEYNKVVRSLEDARLGAELAESKREVRSRLNTRLHALNFIAEEFRSGRLTTKKEFELATSAILNVASEFLAINWIDAERRIAFVWPPENEAQTLGKVVGQNEQVLALINAARSSGQPKSTTLVPLFQGGRVLQPTFLSGEALSSWVMSTASSE